MSENDKVAAFLATRKPLDDRTARIIAGWWHNGQSSALYSFASCGNVTTAAINEALKNIDQCIHRGAVRELPALRKLLAYLRSHRTQKGAQEGWDKRTAY